MKRIIEGQPNEIIADLQMLIGTPDILTMLEGIQQRVPFLKRQVASWQAAVVYYAALDCNYRGKRILEIGTAWGFSAAVMSTAAPKAAIVTLNPKPEEYVYGVKHLQPYRNVFPFCLSSWQYRSIYDGPGFDLIFVDGDHSREAVLEDCKWWDRILPGGMMLFHDYSPEGSGRPSPSVIRAVDAWAALLKLEPDLLVRDHTGTGMVGFYHE